MKLDATNVLDETDLDMPTTVDGDSDSSQNARDIKQPQAETATDASDESERDGDDTGLTRIVLLNVPEIAMTSVSLVVQQIGPKAFCESFGVRREYETSPHEQERLLAQFHEDAPQATMEAAIEKAASDAVFWLERNSDDNDEHAQEAIEFMDQWRDSFEQNGSVEDMPEELTAFDSCIFKYDAEDLPDEFKQLLAQLPEATPAPDATPAEATDETASGDTDGKASESKPLPKLVVTDEAQAHFESERQRLATMIANASIELSQLKAAVKATREAIDDYTEDLQQLIERGPERMPLFDRKKDEEPQMPTDPAAADISSDSELDQQPPASDNDTPAADPRTDESWRNVLMTELAGLSESILDVLSRHDIRTLGDWVNAPLIKGCEYTQLKGVTEKRLEKIQAAMDAFWAGQPQA